MTTLFDDVWARMPSGLTRCFGHNQCQGVGAVHLRKSQVWDREALTHPRELSEDTMADDVVIQSKVAGYVARHLTNEVVAAIHGATHAGAAPSNIQRCTKSFLGALASGELDNRRFDPSNDAVQWIMDAVVAAPLIRWGVIDQAGTIGGRGSEVAIVLRPYIQALRPAPLVDGLMRYTTYSVPRASCGMEVGECQIRTTGDRVMALWDVWVRMPGVDYTGPNNPTNTDLATVSFWEPTALDPCPLGYLTTKETPIR